MQYIGITRINEKDEEIAECLQTLGMRRMSARSLAGIRSLGTAKTREIEKIAGLHQPEVSVGVKDLIERGWVSESVEYKRGKGRPCKVYKLKVRFHAILAELQLAIRKEEMKVVILLNTLRAQAKQTPVGMTNH